MSSTWIVAGLYLLIVCSLGLIVWWEYQRSRKKSSQAPSTGHDGGPDASRR